MGTTALGYFTPLVVYLLLSGAYADKQCNIQCHGSPGQTFKYDVGTTYRYKLDGSTVTEVQEARSDVEGDNSVNRLTLTATADVTAQPNCAYVLTLSDVHLTTSDGQVFKDAAELESKPITFGMNNGRLTDEICASEGESTTALNIKRAVISLLQVSNPQPSGHLTNSESDIFGRCPTNTYFETSGGNLKARKTRDLNKCKGREQLNVPYLMTSYFSKSDVQSIPLMHSNQEVDQKIAGGILKSAVSTETYDYSPLETVSGVKVTVLTKLNFVSQTKRDPPGPPGSVVRRLLFEPPHTHEDDSKEAADAIGAALHEACGDSAGEDHGVHEDEAGAFARLVGAITKASKQQVLAAFANAKSGSGYKHKDHARHILMDGIRAAKSSSSVEVMTELILKKEVTGKEAEVWKLALGNVRHVSHSGLKTAIPLLDGEPTTNAYLGVGSLAGRYCKEHSCQGSADLVALEQKLAAPLLTGTCTPETLDAEDHLLASLKGLSNVGYLTDEVAAKLAECAAKKGVRTRVRAAILDTIRTDPQKANFKAAATTILKDMTEDSELRIKSYLILAECPCPKTADTIREVLEHEKVNQVGSYIVSHLRNLRSTANPNKEAAKHHFGHIMTGHRFPFDIRKFSQNHEFSYSLDDINVGATAETDIIYSQKSFVPRSVSLNLTTQLFGHSFNWLEMDARVENLDHFFEGLFGPRGKFKTHSGNELLEEFVQKGGDVENRIKQKYGNTWRPTRSVSRAQLEAMDKKSLKLKMASERRNMFYENKKEETTEMQHEPRDAHHDVVDLDLSLKMFGADKGWYNYHSTEDKLNWDVLFDQGWGYVDHSINRAKHLKVDHSRHLTWLDGEIAYPTSLGLPMKLKMLASEAIKVGLEGKFDLPAIVRDPDNADVGIKVLASAVIDLSGSLSIDGTLVENGVRLTTTVHTSTGVELLAHLLNGKGVDVKVNLPLEKQQLFTAKSRLDKFAKHRGHPETHTPVKFEPQSEEPRTCFDQLTEIVGLTFCGTLDISPSASLMSPAKLSAWVEKEQDLKQFHFKIFFDVDPEHHGVNFDVLFDTPETKVDRKLNLGIQLALEPKPLVKITAHVPWYSVHFQGDLTDTPKEKTLAANLKLGPDEYSMKAGVKVAGAGGSTVKYEPFLDYKAPQTGQPSKLVTRKGAKQTASTYSLTGAVNVKSEQEKTTYDLASLSLHTPKIVLTANGHILRKPEFLDTDLKITYDKENVAIKAKFDFSGHPDAIITLAIAPSEFPDFGINANWVLDVENDYETIDSVITVVHGPDPNSEDARITIKNYFHIKDDEQHQEFATKNAVTYPILNFGVKLNAEFKPHSLGYDIGGKFADYEGSSSLNAKWSMKAMMDYHYQFKAIATNHAEPKTYSIEIESSHNLVEEDKSKFANKLEITPGGKYMLNADVIHKIDDDDIHLNVDAELHLPVEPSVCRFLAGIKSDDNEASGLLKVSAGSKKYVDFTYNIKQTPHPSGKYNLLLPGFVKSNGDFVLSPSNFKSSSKIELSKYGRTMEAKADIKIAEPKYTGYFLVNWDTKKPDKTLKIETNSMFSHNEFDTKNTIIFENQKTQLNLKGKSTGTCEDGSQSGEVELILPNTRHVIGRFSRAMETEPGDNEGEIVVELIDYEKKGDQPTKLMLKLVGKHVDWQRNQFDGQAAATYTDKHGKDLAAHATLKKMPTSQSREKWTINGQYQVHGSLITTPLDIKFDSEVHSLWLEGKLNPDNSFPPLTYHVTSSAGEGRTLDAVGKLNGNILSNELTVKLPKGESPTLHTLKWTTNCNIVAPVDPAHHLKIKSNNVLAWNGDKFFKTNCDFTEEDTGAKIKLEWESDSFSKRTFTVSGHGIECEKAEDKCAYDFSFANDFDGKHADVTVKVDHDYGFNWANVHMLGTTFDAQKFDILVKNKEIKEGKGELTELVATIGQKKYTGNSHVEVLDGHILVDLSLEQPEGKSRFMWKHDKKGELHFANQLKVKWIGHGGGTLNSDHEMNLNSLNELLIDGTLDSAALGIDNLQIHVANGAQNAKGLKGAKGGSGKGISFYVKKAGKNLYSGNLSYNVKITDDHGSFEGSGNMKIGDKPYPLSVKANFAEKDDDQELKITASAGPFSLNGDYKKSKNEFKFQRTICRNGKNDCSTGLVHFYRKLDGEHKEHKIEVIADLSFWSEKIHDIKFLALTKETKTSHEENLDLVWSPTGKLKYHYHLAPRKMIALLEVPSRTLAYEVEVATPHTSKEHSSGRMDANFWWHKKADPNKKLSAQITWDYKDTKTLTTLSGDLQFTAPSLSRPLKAGGKLSIKEEVEDKVAIDGHADIDIFAEPSQAIKAALKINSHADEKNKKFLYNALLTARSPGLKMDMKYDHKFTLTSADSTLMSSEKFTYLDSAGQVRDSIFNVHITPQKLIVLLKFPDFVFLDFNGKIEKKTKGGSEEVTVLTANSNILGAKYRETLTVNPTPMYKYQLVFSKAGGEKILDATLGFKKGGELKVNFDKKKLIDMHIELTPDNYLKPKYTFDIENSEHFYNTVNAELAHISQLTENAAHQLVEKGATEMAYVFGSMARALPDTGPMVDALNKELEAIRAEIASDVYLKDVLGDLGESLRLIIEQFVLVIEELSHFWASVDIMITDTIEKVNVIVQDVAPRLRTSITNIMQVLRDLYTEWSHFASQLVNLGLKELKRIEDELKIIIDSYAEYFRDLGKGVLNLVAVAEKELTNIIHNLIDFFNDLPVMEFINQRISELAGFESPEEVLWTITQVLEQLKSMAPSDGVAHLIEVLSGYVEKIMKKEEFDLDEAAENIFKALVAAIESLAKFLEENGISNDIDVWDTMQSYVKSSPTSALMAPKGSLRLSILEWLISADLPEVEDLIATYFPFNILKPFSYFPPYAAMGTILGNGDVITFDGVHLSLGHTGERAYILAKDITDGNFTLVAGFGANGKLNSVELSDGKDNIEIRHEKTALVNGKESEYLVSQGSMNAWRTPSECGIFSRAGVLVKCDSDFRWCLVTIDGFYHNRLRGILGNPNYEPFDDTATSLAKIAGNTGEFAKSWRLTEGEETPHPAHEHERQQLCTDFFSGEDSNFAGCTRELYCDYPESIKAEDGVQGAKHVLPGQEAGDDGNMVCFYSEPVGPWRAACDHALHKAKDEEQKRVAACGVAAAYAHACRSRGNPLSLLPDECVVCKVGDKRLKKEETQVVTLPGKSADVLFVVELDKEVEGLYQNLLGPLVNSLQSDFKEQGINDVHFGLAGYGGVAKEYTVYYTTGGKIKFNGKSEAIKFTPHGPMPNVTLIDKLKVLWNMINEEIGNTDRLRAYNDVMLEYNFRPEAVKVIVGLNAHPCETGEDLISLATLRTLLGFGLYKAMGVHINYIYPFKVAIDDDKSKTVVGFNQDRVFTLENSHSRPIAGLPNKVDDLEYDTDVCVFFNKLINGNVLAGGNFKTTSDKPKFISIASQMIVHSATKDLTTVECTCQTSLDLLRSRPICTVDDVAERKPKKAAFTKKVKG